MDKSQISRGALACVLSTKHRRRLLARFILPVLFLALSLVGLQPMTTANTDGNLTQARTISIQAKTSDCQDVCLDAYTQCLALGGGPICDAQYTRCLADCQ